VATKDENVTRFTVLTEKGRIEIKGLKKFRVKLKKGKVILVTGRGGP
jgi:hypothetical protein